MKKIGRTLILCLAICCLFFSMSLTSVTAASSVTINLLKSDEGLTIATNVKNASVVNGDNSAWFGILKLPNNCSIANVEQFEEVETSWGVWCLEEQSDGSYYIECDFGVKNFEITIPLESISSGEVSLNLEEVRVNNVNCGYSEDSVLSLTLGASSEATTIPTSSIIDTTNGAATVTGTVENGKATLNVASDKACTVAYTTDDGATYTRVNAAQADSGYNFVVPDYLENMKFVVALKGDSNGDGNVNTADSMTIARSCLSNTHSAYLERSAINDCLYDINGDNQVNTADSMLIARACLSTTHAAYQALTW